MALWVNWRYTKHIGTNDLGHGDSAEIIFYNLQELSKFALGDNSPVNGLLNVGIPDSAFLSRDCDARSKRDQVNDMLAGRNHVKLHYIHCPLKYSRGSKHYETDGLHFSEAGYNEFANGIYDSVKRLLD